MKKITRYIFIVSLLFLIFNLCVVKVEANTTPEYLTWDNSSSYLLSNDLESAPLTIEATIKLSAGYTSRAGVIFSNYTGSARGYMTFEIYTNGNPSITFVDMNGIKISGLYKNINVATGDWVHLTFVMDGNKCLCYIDGELKETKVFNEPYESHIPLTRFAVGGDRRTDKSQFFKGEIAQLAVYSDKRNEEEVKNDCLLDEIDKNNLMVAYDFSNLTSLDVIEDLSQNDNDLRKQYEEIREDLSVNPAEYDYTIVAVGDTQNVTCHRDEYTKTIYDYLIDNIETMNIRHIAGMGDITNNSNEYEYLAAAEQFKRLDGVVPYSLVRGNHDSTVSYEKYLGVDAQYCGYSSQYKEYYKNSTNSVHEFSAGNLDYLLITLDFGPTDDVLEWANGVVEAHPYHNVIITTHGYMDTNGLLLRKSNTGSITQHGGDNEGVDIWEKLVSKHSNIVMVLCGHINAEEVKVTRMIGDHGNVVTQLLINTQNQDRYDIEAGGNGYGIVSLLHFSNGGRTVEFRNYATIKEFYYRTYNQFRMNINVVQRKVDSVIERIANLPTKDNITLADEVEILELNELYLTLSEEEKTLVDNTKLVEALNKIDLCNAQVFDKTVLDLPEVVTLNEQEVLLSLKEIYDNSSEFFKQNLEQLEAFEKKLADVIVLVNKANAPLINKEILHLPYPLTLTDQDKVLDLRNRYEQLDEESKKDVIYISKLEEAEAIMDILLQQYEIALEIDELILGLPELVDLGCKDEVVMIREKYSKLDSIAKEYVTNLDILEAAEAAIYDAYSKKKGKVLNELILSLPSDISLLDKGIIESIRNRYDSLDEESKKYVSELFLLETFEARIRILEELKVKVDLLNEKVDSLPSEITLDDKELIESLIEEYKALSPDEKQLFTKLDKLNSAISEMNELINPTENSRVTIAIIGGISGLVLLLGCWFIIRKIIKKGQMA